MSDGSRGDNHPYDKCATKGCSLPKFEPHDFCLTCISESLAGALQTASRTCNNLQAIATDGNGASK